MSDLINSAVNALNEKMSDGFDGNAKFVIENEGAIMVDGDGARAADEEAEVTLTADADTFQAILDGDMDPTAAFMSGKLKVEGNAQRALKVSSILTG